jgi:hypothetical protein
VTKDAYWVNGELLPVLAHLTVSCGEYSGCQAELLSMSGDRALVAVHGHGMKWLKRNDLRKGETMNDHSQKFEGFQKKEVLGPHTPVRYVVRFVGGPKGGEEMEWKERVPIIRVPVFQRPALFEHVPGDVDPHPLYEAEAYELDHYETSRLRNPVWYDYETNTCVETLVYRWKNPAESLRAANRKLKNEVAGLEAKLAEEGKLREAVKVLADIIKE